LHLETICVRLQAGFPCCGILVRTTDLNAKKTFWVGTSEWFKL
jgi:hypothetical protein